MSNVIIKYKKSVDMKFNGNELNVIKFLGDNNNFFRLASSNVDKINTEYTELLIKSVLELSINDVSETIKSLENKKLLVLYFDSGYIQLNDIGEKLYNSKK